MNNCDLENFVKKTCDKAGRDPSHGYEHMKQVYANSMIICKMMKIKDPYILKMVTIVSWLHDVFDHKYDFDGKLKNRVNEFLESHYKPKDIKLILDIIERISFSKENKVRINNQQLDWIEVLGEKGVLIRNIVSDADKLEAIGKEGINRCIMYTKECNENISDDELINNVKKHADEKLLRLKDEFIRTEAGKQLAQPLHEEMKNMLENM